MRLPPQTPTPESPRLFHDCCVYKHDQSAQIESYTQRSAGVRTLAVLMVEKAPVVSQEDCCHPGRYLITLAFQADKPVLNTSCRLPPTGMVQAAERPVEAGGGPSGQTGIRAGLRRKAAAGPPYRPGFSWTNRPPLSSLVYISFVSMKLF